MENLSKKSKQRWDKTKKGKKANLFLNFEEKLEEEEIEENEIKNVIDETSLNEAINKLTEMIELKSNLKFILLFIV